MTATPPTSQCSPHCSSDGLTLAWPRGKPRPGMSSTLQEGALAVDWACTSPVSHRLLVLATAMLGSSMEGWRTSLEARPAVCGAEGACVSERPQEPRQRGPCEAIRQTDDSLHAFASPQGRLPSEGLEQRAGTKRARSSARCPWETASPPEEHGGRSGGRDRAGAATLLAAGLEEGVGWACGPEGRRRREGRCWP